MVDNIHPVVELLAARMESHPEEFGPNNNGRWATWLDQLTPFTTEEERVMLRGPMMQGIHEEVLDELLNGGERRAEEQRQRELDRQRMAQAYATQQVQMQSAMVYNQARTAQQSNAGAYSVLGLSNSNQYTYPTSTPSLQLGNETLNEGLLKAIKGKLGL